MDKEIKLIMLENGDIEVYRSEELCLKIPSDNRVLNGEAIFGLFDYKSGNKYSVVISNESNKDSDALVELQSLFTAIVKGIDDFETVEEMKKYPVNDVVIDESVVSDEDVVLPF